MKKHILFLLLLCSGSLLATRTTYTFYKADWSSKVGTYAASGTDGWVSDKDGESYVTGREAPLGLMDQGVKVTVGYSGAGATSVISFSQVRKISFSYCTNNKKGKGVINVQVGDNQVEKLTIAAPSDNGGVVREEEISLSGTQSGKIKFWVDCTENSIYINQITIKAQNGSPNITGLTMDSYMLVTDVEQLMDGDEVIFGVANTPQKYE